MQHHVIYVPGILDDHHHQGWVVKAWRLSGVRGHIHVMPWVGQGGFEPKLQRLLGRIDELHGQGHMVSLVGASAGASAVLHAYVRRRKAVSGVVCVAGKINYPETVNPRIYARNPAFKTSMELLPDTLGKLSKTDKAKIVSFYSPGDHYVPYEATAIPGVREERLPPLKHGLAIGYSLTMGAPKLLRPLKRLATGR